MSRPNTPASAGQPKTMSSRLLNLKFMQRAAASTSSPLPQASTPFRNADGSPALKRQRTSDSESSAPSTPLPMTPRYPATTPTEAEAKARSEARRRMLAACGETEWVLKLPGMNGMANGSSTARTPEATNAGEEVVFQEASIGRRSYGNFKRTKVDNAPAPSKKSEDGDGELSEGSSVDRGDYVDSGRPLKRKMDAAGQSDENMDQWNFKNGRHKIESISGFKPKKGVHDSSYRRKDR